RAARPRHPSHLPDARRRGAARRGERLDRPPAPPRLRGRGHRVGALRVPRAAGHDVLHLGCAPARESHPLRGRARRHRVGRRRAAARARGQAAAEHTGCICVPILALYAVVYACDTSAWWLTMADERIRPPFWRAYAITVAGFSLNFVTPMVNVGGEPFKIAAAARWLGVRRAAGSVVIYQVLHTLGMLLSFLTAIVLGLLLLPPHPALRAGLVVAFVVLALLCWLLLTGHRRGVLESALDLI